MATWPLIIDDDGTGNTGTATDKALFDQIKNYVDDDSSPPGVVTVTNGGSNIFNVTLPSSRPFYVVRVVPTSADITLQGITPGRNGDRVLIYHAGTTIGLTVWMQANAGASSWHKNRITSGKTPIAPSGSALYVYDQPTNYWVLVQHDQGTMVRVAFAAGNYLSSVGAWTVEAADVAEHDWYVYGNLMTVNVTLLSTAVSGTPGTIYVRGWPWNFSAVGNARTHTTIYSAGSFIHGLATYDASFPQFSIGKFDSSTFANVGDLQVHLHTTVRIT